MVIRIRLPAPPKSMRSIIDATQLVQRHGNANKPYGSIAKLLHWGFVLLFVYGISKQLDEINELEDIALLKFEVVFASAFLILLIIRFIYMKVTQNSS